MTYKKSFERDLQHNSLQTYKDTNINIGEPAVFFFSLRKKYHEIVAPPISMNVRYLQTQYGEMIKKTHNVCNRFSSNTIFTIKNNLSEFLG